MSGDQLLGLAAVLTAIGGLISIFLNGRRTRKTVDIGERLEGVLGDPGRESFAQLLFQIRAIAADIRTMTEFVHETATYQRTRNHDIMNSLHRIETAVPLLIRQLEAMERRRNDEGDA